MQTNSTAKNSHSFRLPPQAIDAEEVFLSACMLGAAPDAVPLLTPLDFYKTAHQHIFSAIGKILKTGNQVDLVTVVNQLRDDGRLDECGGAAYVSRLISEIPAAGCTEAYAAIIRKAAMRRQVIVQCNEVARLAYDCPDIETLLGSARRLSDIEQPSKASVFTSYAQLAQTEMEKWEQNDKLGGTGIPSGYAKIDGMTGGFQDTDLVILAARPAMGKSALMINIAENVAASKHPASGPVVIFSLEMSKGQIYARQTARSAKVDSQKFRVGGIQPAEWDRIVAAQSYLHDVPVYIDDSGSLTVREIEARSRMAANKLGARLIIVDHLQRIKGNPQSQRKDLDIGEITGALKTVAKDLGLPVVLLSQLNRSCESRDDKRPRLSDLRESGAIEQDADIVMFMYRDEYYYPDKTSTPGIAEINFAKNRNGKTGTILLTWIPWRQSFENHMPETGAQN